MLFDVEKKQSLAENRALVCWRACSVGCISRGTAEINFAKPFVLLHSSGNIHRWHPKALTSLCRCECYIGPSLSGLGSERACFCGLELGSLWSEILLSVYMKQQSRTDDLTESKSAFCKAILKLCGLSHCVFSRSRMFVKTKTTKVAFTRIKILTGHSTRR